MDRIIKPNKDTMMARQSTVDNSDPSGNSMRSRINRLRMIVGALVLLALCYGAFTTTVSEMTSVIVMRMGKPQRVLEKSGLHWKLPWPLEEGVEIDRRRRTFQTQHTEMLTKDKKNVVLMSFVIWSVDDPLKMFQSIGSIEQVDGKLNGLITNAKIGVLGKYDLSALASTNPEEIQVTKIEEELLALTQDLAKTQYGIALHHVGFSRLSLPKENISAVFRQMKEERQKYAIEFRGKGEQAASQIRTDTDAQVALLRAQMTEEVAQIQGEAQAQAAEIYANAHRQDPDLYEFIRSLQTLEEVIGPKSVLILRTDAEPFNILVNGK